MGQLALRFAFLCLPGLVSSQGQVHLVESDTVDRTGSLWTIELESTGDFNVKHKVGRQTGGFGHLDYGVEFGSHMRSLGDLDGNGRDELIVAPEFRDFLWVLFFDETGAVEKSRFLSRFDIPEMRDLRVQGPNQPIPLCTVGDVDGDGTTELILWDRWHDSQATPEIDGLDGAFYLISLDAEAEVTASRRLNVPDGFFAHACFGDLDGDGVIEIIGNTTLYEIAADFSISVEGSFPNHLGHIVPVGDVDQDGVGDYATGQTGSLRILYLNPDGSVRDFADIPEPVGVNFGAGWGTSLAAVGDRNGDGIAELAFGAPTVNNSTGWVAVVQLDSTPSVVEVDYISGSFLTVTDRFGTSLVNLGDLDGNGLIDLAISAPGNTIVTNEADFTEVQDAVDAALDGDVILVRGGTYDQMVIENKDLVIQAYPGSRPTIDARGATLENRIEDLDISKTVVLRGLILTESGALPGSTQSPQTDVPPVLTLKNNSGTVWIEDCNITGRQNMAPHPPGLLVDGSSSVVLIDSGFLGEYGLTCAAAREGGRGGTGMEVRGGSSVHAYGCLFWGGWGGRSTRFNPNCDSFEGGDGVLVAGPSDFLFLSDCLLRGAFFSCTPDCICEPGGLALVNNGQVVKLDSTLVGDPGGTVELFGTMCTSPAGPARSGPIDRVAGRALGLRVRSPESPGQAHRLVFDGPPHSLFLLGIGGEARAVHAALIEGSFLLQEVLSLDLIGFSDERGQLIREIPAPTQTGALFYQSFYVELNDSPSQTTGLAGAAYRPSGIQAGGGTAAINVP